jgi:hypothetical protein
MVTRIDIDAPSNLPMITAFSHDRGLLLILSGGNPGELADIRKQTRWTMFYLKF